MLDHMEVRDFLYPYVYPLCPFRFAELAGLHDAEWTTDPVIMMNYLDDIEYWWGVGHSGVWIIPTAVCGPIVNAVKYDENGRPIRYHQSRFYTPIADALCRAFLKAKYDLPPEYMVRNKASEA